MCNAYHEYDTITTSLNWVFVCACVVYGCVKLISGNTITNSINHFTPMFIIFTMNFLVFLLASYPHWDVCYLEQTFEEKKKRRDWNVLSTYFTYSLPSFYDYISTKFIVGVHLLAFRLTSPSLSLFLLFRLRLTFVCVPIHAVFPSTYLYLPKNEPLVHPVGYPFEVKKKDREDDGECVALYSFGVLIIIDNIVYWQR